MCYLLLGNISALISDDHVEPLAKACIRVYLPDGQYPTGYDPKRNIFTGPGQLSAAEVDAKRERLLAETRLDEKGNFTVGWELVHLFTEPLELDICLDQMPEQVTGMELQYHLGTLTPHWKFSGQRYVAAYAYVIPAESWNEIRAIYGTWVIAGTIKRNYARAGQTQFRVEVYNAGNQRLLARAETDEQGRYQLRFSRQPRGGTTAPVETGPDVYFKIYRNDQLLWGEATQVAARPGRRAIPACSVVDILLPLPGKPVANGKTRPTPGWLSNWTVKGRKSTVVSY